MPEFKSKRLGKRRQGHVRPICVFLPSNQDVMRVMQNRSRYLGPARISVDQTVRQRLRFKELQMELKSLRDAGDDSKTIRYTHGIPRIVNMKRREMAKN